MKWSRKSRQGDLVDVGGWAIKRFLVVSRGLIAEGAMKTAGIVEGLNVIEDHAIGLSAGGWEDLRGSIRFSEWTKSFPSRRCRSSWRGGILAAVAWGTVSPRP
jgi:hypothetical protein